MMGSYGGSAFLVVYIAFTILFAFPALMAEMTLGRMSRKGTLHALRLSFGNFFGGALGYLLLLVVTVAGSYYAVVVGNVVYTTFFSLFVGFSDDTIPAFKTGLSNGWLQYLITLITIAVSLSIIYTGLTRGIERISNVIMPLFFLSLIYMIVHALSLPGAIDKCLEFLKPDLTALKSSEVFAALGQAFFSVGLGGTFVVVYAGFFRSNESIPKMALFTGLGDMSASLLISLFLVPSVLVFGMEMTSGPTLIFNTFPYLFSTMPGGRFVGSLFLVSIFLVAFLSLVAAYQVPFTSIQSERPAMNTKKILLAVGLLQASLALPSSLFPSVIGTLDLVFGSGMQVLGSVMCILGLTWGLKQSNVLSQMFNTHEPSPVSRTVYFWIKWVIPLALLAVLIRYIYDVAL